jgi:hypothetical protein
MGRKSINKVDKSINEFLIALHKAISNVGTDNLVTTFKQIRPVNFSIKDEFIANKIVELTCDAYSLNENVFDEDSRSDGIYQDFMCVVSYLLKKYARYNQNEIGEKIKRHKSQVSKYVTRISQLKPNDKVEDSNIYNKLTAIEKKLSDFLKKKNEKIVKTIKTN